MDLSPGRRSDPARFRAGRITTVESVVICLFTIADKKGGVTSIDDLISDDLIGDDLISDECASRSAECKPTLETAWRPLRMADRRTICSAMRPSPALWRPPW